jgi:hypothetical protein
MAFTTISPAQIAAGEPTAQELFTKIKDNFDDHETRITATEGSLLTIAPIVWDLYGFVGRYSAQTAITPNLLIRSNITLLSCRLMIDVAGTSGTTEFDILYKRGANPFATIFTTRPSVGFAAGDNAVSTNAILSVTTLQVGDILRLDLTSAQPQSKNCSIYLEWEAT